MASLALNDWGSRILGGFQKWLSEHPDATAKTMNNEIELIEGMRDDGIANAVHTPAGL